MSARRRAQSGSAGQMGMDALILDAAAPLTAETNDLPDGGYVVEAELSPPRRAAQMSTPIYSIKLVQTGNLPLPGGKRPTIRSPRDAGVLLDQYLAGVDREHFVVLLLNTKGQLIGISTTSIGDLSSAIVHPREVFKPAILANAASVVLAHNHPSGDPTPSSEDIAITQRLKEAGDMLGIAVIDHVVIGEPGRFVSLKERGLCP